MANRRFIDFPIASTVGDNDIVLIWQDGANKQTTKATILSGLPENLDELNDVVISGLTNGQILRYDSVTGKWVNTDQGNLDLNDLNDVSIVSPSNGQVLVYNSSTSKWENSSGGFVPYVGAVTTVDLGAQGLRAGYVRFDTSVVTVPDEQGLMYWDDSRSTVALIMNGTLQHIGQDSFFYVKNSSGSTIPKGTCVGFAGTDGGSGHLLVTPFLANGSVPSTYFMGVTCESIANGSFGQVMHFGELTGINTSGFTAGALLYASSTVAGGFQTTAPVAPNNIILVAAAVNSKNNGAIVVRPTLGSNFGTNESVKLTSVTDKDLLQYTVTGGVGLWENKTLAQVIGSAYVPSTRTITINGVTQDLSANRTFNVGTVTGVTATSPLFSSGGTTPNITIQQAGASASGFLSSTDWNTFNNKQNTISLTTTGTSGVATLIGTTLNIPNYGGALSGYLPLTGGTLTGPLGGTSASFSGDVTANRYRGVNSLVLNSYTTVNPSSNVFLYSQPNDRDAWIFLDSADTGSNWGIYHRQIDSTVSGLPANSIGFVGGGSSTLQAWISLENGNGYFAGSLTASNLSGTNTGNVTLGTANGLGLTGQQLSLGLASGSTNGALSSTDWNTFNNKQNALTNPVTGTGTTNYLPKFTGSTTIGNSQIFDNGTNVGINQAVPLAKFDILQTSSSLGGWFMTSQFSATNYPMIILGAITPNKYSRIGNDGDGSFAFFTNGSSSSLGTQSMTLTSGGNLGLGVTPSAWNSSVKVIEIANTGNFIGNSGNDNWLATNTIYDSGATFRYARTGSAVAFYSQSSGGHFWFNAPVGTAGNAISFTQAMTLNASGNLLVGTTSDNGARLQVNGRVNATGGGSNGVLVSSNSGSVTIPTTGLSLNTGFNVGYLQNFNGGNYVDLYYGASKHIFDGGNVGIGTSSPSTRLHVNYTSGTGFTLSNNVANLYSEMALISANSGAYIFKSSSGYTSYGGANALNIFNEGQIAFHSNSVSNILYLTAGGNTLVGTTSDNGQRLQVNGSISSGFANTSALLVQSNGTATTGAAIALQQLTPEGDTIIFGDYEPFAEYGIIARNSLDSIDFTGGTTNGSLDNYNITNRSGNVRTAYVKARIGLGSGITAFGGSVGIGTSSPTTLLQVEGSAPIFTMNRTSGGFINRINFSSGGTNYASIISDAGAGEQRYSIGPSAGWGGYHTFYTDTTERMRITSGGNVLIGTTTDNGNRLRVNGNSWFDGEVAVNAITCTSGNTNTFINPIGTSGIIYSGQGTTAVHQFLVNSGERFAVLNTGIRTIAPTGGTAVPWRLGTSRGGTVTSNATVRVEIDGALVDLVARYV